MTNDEPRETAERMRIEILNVLQHATRGVGPAEWLQVDETAFVRLVLERDARLRAELLAPFRELAEAAAEAVSHYDAERDCFLITTVSLYALQAALAKLLPAPAEEDDGFGCCGGNDDEPREHTMDCVTRMCSCRHSANVHVCGTEACETCSCAQFLPAPAEGSET